MLPLIFKHFYKQNKIIVRYKHRADHWSVVRKKVHPVDKALAHFDEFYKSVFTNRWPLIREGLLSQQKYVAVVNNWGDNEETIKYFESIGAINVRTLFQIEKEYLLENYTKRTKHKLLNRILKMDEEMENQQEDNQTGEQEQKDDEEKRDLSLQNSLNKAELDSKRLIDFKTNVLSTENLQQYVPVTKIKGKDDFIPESTYYQFSNIGNFKIKIEKQYDFHFPEHLNVYCFEEENFTEWEPSPMSSTGVLNYYLMDGASILPVLALDIKPGHRILDMCAAPGGKSLLSLQTLYPNLVVSNDVSLSRVNRIYKVYRQFLYDLEDRWIKSGKLKITNEDGRYMNDDLYDRILVDVPCTTDRHSVNDNESNIFQHTRIKERLKIPELQCQLLVNALKLVKVNGIVVYSTCSLSPIQNDGVVHMALKQIWEETKIEVVVKDMAPAMMQGSKVYKFASGNLLKFGSLIIPHVSQNYGPIYFCKLQRVK